MSKKEMTTEKRLKVRLYLSLLIYTVVGYGLYFVSDARLYMYLQLLLEKAVGLSG